MDSGECPLAEQFESIGKMPGAEEGLRLLLCDLAQLTLAVSRAHQALGSKLTSLAVRHGLTASELLVLWLCARTPDTADSTTTEIGWVQNEIAHSLGFSPAQTSSVVDKLQQRTLLQSKRSIQDRRRQLCQTTANGRQLLQLIAQEWETVSTARMLSDIEGQLSLAISHLRYGAIPLPDGLSRPAAVTTSTQRGAA